MGNTIGRLIRRRRQGEDGGQRGDSQSLEVPAALRKAIVAQLEYYFGDLNLYRETFLRDYYYREGGWVPMAVMLTYGRLARLSSDPRVIAISIRSARNNLVQVSDGMKIRRNPNRKLININTLMSQEVHARSVYIKGFPEETTKQEILLYFRQFQGIKVVEIVMRKFVHIADLKRTFKGNVYVTFQTSEQAEKFMMIRQRYVFKDSILVAMWEDDYMLSKQTGLKLH